MTVDIALMLILFLIVGLVGLSFVMLVAYILAQVGVMIFRKIIGEDDVGCNGVYRIEEKK